MEIGDKVRLASRERPHQDDPKRWWLVVGMSETGFDAIGQGGEVRHHIAFHSVRALEAKK